MAGRLLKWVSFGEKQRYFLGYRDGGKGVGSYLIFVYGGVGSKGS